MVGGGGRSLSAFYERYFVFISFNFQFFDVPLYAYTIGTKAQKSEIICSRSANQLNTKGEV